MFCYLHQESTWVGKSTISTKYKNTIRIIIKKLKLNRVTTSHTSNPKTMIFEKKDFTILIDNFLWQQLMTKVQLR